MSDQKPAFEYKVFAVDPLINLPLLVVSGLLYITLVEWVDFVRCSAVRTFADAENEDVKKARPEHKFFFAVFLTVVTVVVLILIYVHYRG